MRQVLALFESYEITYLRSDASDLLDTVEKEVLDWDDIRIKLQALKASSAMISARVAVLSEILGAMER